MPAKVRLRCGMLIRRKSEFDVPIGPYMFISRLEKEYVIANPVNMPNQDVMIQRSNVHRVRTVNLPVSPERLKTIKEGICTVVAHPVSLKWADVYENPPEVVIFTANNWLQKVYATVDYTEKKYVALYKEHQIRVYINYVIV